jgi:glycerol-3-phosphate acyltransferase PlsY
MTLTPFHLVLWILFALLCGSLPFSVWVSRLLARKDARQVGDRNPGAINALKAGGWKVGLLAFVLDVSKGALPVGMAYVLWNWRGWEIVPVALGALFGSAFSPFLGFRGGKSLSVSLGIWIGLTIWQAPLAILSSLTAVFLIQSNSGWAVVAAILGLGLYVAFAGNLPFWTILGVQALVLLWKHRADLRQPAHLRAWLAPKR